MPSLNRLETILQSKIILIVLSIIAFGYGIYHKLSPKQSNYREGDVTLTVTVESYQIQDNQVTIEAVAKEPLTIYGSLETEEDREIFQKLISVGDKLQVTGTLKELTNQTYPNLFSYKEYANREGKFYTMELISYQKVKSTWRSYLYRWFHKYECEYMDVYFFLNLQKLPDSFQEVNWAPFFSMYSLLLRPIRKKKKWYLCMLLLLALTTNFAPKVLALLFLFYLRTHHLSFSKSLYLTLLFRVILEPNILFTSTFFYIGIIYGTLVILIQNRIYNPIVISYLLNIMTLPIFISQNFYFHPILFFIQPFILYAIRLGFIGVLLNTVIPFQFVLNPYFDGLTAIAKFLSDTSFLKITFAKLPVYFLILCYLCIAVFLLGIIKRKWKYIVPILSFALLHYLIPNLLPRQDVFYLDVGQGDATLIRMDHKTILIDTGGIMGIGTIEESRTKQLVSNKLIPFFRSLGISKIDYLIITHGDYDHIGGAIHFVHDFKIEKVIFNCGAFDELEQELIEFLNKKKIPYYSCIKELNISDNKLYFLNHKDYGNENDNSSVIYTEINNYKFLFMGDARAEVEQDLIEKYNLTDIDVLKVGHHGSKTSSSKSFINEIKPKYSVISAGKNNLYGHPNDSVLNNLIDSQIYRTDQDGSIMFKIKNNKLEIETYLS